MVIVKIEFETGNAAFENKQGAIADLLKHTVDRFIRTGSTDFNLRDYNGNNIGTFKFEDHDDE
jgi:hypothetical protein